MSSPFIRLHPKDNVAVVGVETTKGASFEGVRLAETIPTGHKFALKPIGRGEAVRKYNQIIGFATRDIAPGDHVHTHNVGMGDTFERNAAISAAARPTLVLPEAEQATFQGIVRPDGRVATRNYIGVLTTVNCSAAAARMVAEHFRGDALKAWPGVDGVVALTHGYGCGMASEGEAMTTLRRTLAGYARHANFGAVAVIGLGCENNQISRIAEEEGLAFGDTLKSFSIQQLGGTRATVDAVVAYIGGILPQVANVSRQTVSARHLTLALQCGGSDGYSGITANPALGAAVDTLIRNGGAAVLSETSEIYGAEHLLTCRAASPEIGEKLLERLKWWEAYTARTGDEMNNNPSVGNKTGGLTTILEKSLGAVAKAGTTDLNDVLLYAEPIKAPGLSFMDTPGYDPVSATGQVAGGANILCFTTGRGSVFGCKPAPSLKLATNTSLFRRMQDDMDLDCGGIATGETDIETVGRRIFDLILATASGAPSKSEALGIGQDEFLPWQMGAVM
jgi:altronate hydrolase